MSIKGTLETFNLCELLQMLAFNQKEGTLVLESDQGTRTVFLSSGRLGFLEQDAGIAESALRLARRLQIAPEERLQTAVGQCEEGGRHLVGVFESMGLIEGEQAQDLLRDATLEQLFECQLTSVAGFEFVEGRELNPDGSDGRAIQPLFSVESLLLDLARMIDHWNTASGMVHGTGEIYEGTGIAVDLSEQEDIDADLADDVVPLIDGCRSIQSIAEACHTTVYQVMQIVAALVDGGGVRDVPTEDLQRRADDLLATGDAERAIPLLERCIERGDASVEVRIRLADAFEASGRPKEAAAELDAFAALCDEDENTEAVFEALVRALSLREGDAATAARACDYYLRRRPWLQDHRGEATRALRDLITGAATARRPMDAALRLKGFIDAGDAPIDDLRLLAELFEEAGERQDAAATLYRRAEHFLAEHKTPGAREALRRALELDPGHANARRRLMELDGVRRRRGHRARIALILLALAGVGSAAGVAWFAYSDTASTEIVETQTAAQLAVEQAEGKARERIEAFRLRAQTAAEGTEKDSTLAEAASAMRGEVGQIIAQTTEPLGAYGEAIDAGQAAGRVESHKEELDRYRQRCRLVTQQAASAVTELRDEAKAALAEARVRHRKGAFMEARKLLLCAWNLGFDDEATRTDAERTLQMIQEYIGEFDKLRTRMDAQTKAGKLQTAFTMGIEGVGLLLDSDLTRELEFPVHLTSAPEGAQVWLGAEDTGMRTPCVLTYSPFAEDLRLALRMPGRTPAQTTLPAYAQMRRDPESLAGYDPEFSAQLVPGARWRVSDATDKFHALWAGHGMPLVAGASGRLIYAVGTRDGRLVPGERVDPTSDGIRRAGRHATGLEWRITGHRTLTVRTAQGKSWEQIVFGRLEKAPLLVAGLVVAVDEAGAVYAWDASTGEKRWNVVDLNAAPTQGIVASPLGLLLGTKTGASYRIAPDSGKATELAPRMPGAVFVLAYGDGAVVLGGGTAGCRFVDETGRVKTLGDAGPNPDRGVWAGAGGIAWIEDDGVRWLAAGATAPVAVPGLGGHAEFLTGDGQGRLFAVCADGRVRAASLSAPEQALWTAPLGGRAEVQPILIDGGLYVLVDGSLLAFDV